MNARLIKYNEYDGKTVEQQKVRVYFASSSKPPTICIQLPDEENLNCEVYVSAKELLALILGRILDKIEP